MTPSPDGPRPEVLARLAEGVPAEQQHHVVSRRARALGWALCVVTAATVLVAIVTAGAP